HGVAGAGEGLLGPAGERDALVPERGGAGLLVTLEREEPRGGGLLLRHPLEPLHDVGMPIHHPSLISKSQARPTALLRRLFTWSRRPSRWRGRPLLSWTPMMLSSSTLPVAGSSAPPVYSSYAPSRCPPSWPATPSRSSVRYQSLALE